jgi:hypothetical protein
MRLPEEKTMLRSVIGLLCLSTAIAAAQPAPATTTTAATTPEPASVAPADGGATLRNGFSLSAGEEFASVAGMSLSGQLYGVDWRIGAKLSDALSVYVHSHLSFGTAHIGTASGVTGNFAGALIAEYTLPQRIFVGGGGGYGVLNNPSGPLAEARVGYYPFQAKTTGAKVRRLNVALDGRWYFADGITVTQVALSLGYDRF